MDRKVKSAWGSSTLYRHRMNGYKILLTHKELLEIIEKTTHCIYCGLELDWKAPRKVNVFPSLDRIDNEKVLRKDNVQIVCRRCNVTKRDRTHAEFLEYCNLVVNNNKANIIIGGE